MLGSQTHWSPVNGQDVDTHTTASKEGNKEALCHSRGKHANHAALTRKATYAGPMPQSRASVCDL